MYLKCWVLEKAETSPFFQEAMITFRKVAFCGQGLQVKEETYFLMRTREGALENPHCWNYLSCGKKSDMMLEVGVWLQFCGLLTLWLGSSQPTITETHVTSLMRWRCHWVLEDVMVPCIYLALAGRWVEGEKIAPFLWYGWRNFNLFISWLSFGYLSRAADSFLLLLCLWFFPASSQVSFFLSPFLRFSSETSHGIPPTSFQALIFHSWVINTLGSSGMPACLPLRPLLGDLMVSSTIYSTS